MSSSTPEIDRYIIWMQNIQKKINNDHTNPNLKGPIVELFEQCVQLHEALAIATAKDLTRIRNQFLNSDSPE